MYDLTTYRYDKQADCSATATYYSARYYDPQTGRFLNEDPIGFAGRDVNLYRYVYNHSVDSTDPSGFSPKRTDKWWGHNDANFRWWWHNCYWKGEPYDGTREEVEAAWEIWNSLGRPEKGNCGDNNKDKKECEATEPAPEPVPGPTPEQQKEIQDGTVATGVVGTALIILYWALSALN